VALSKSFEAFATELLAGVGPIRVKRMFGGAAAYLDDRIFALFDDEAIWIKVDDLNEPAFVAEGMPRLSYPAKDGKIMEMAYRRLPEAALDDADEAVRWARLGVEAALRKPVKARKAAKARKGE
jgi:DNA transformation protein and related proteins